MSLAGAVSEALAAGRPERAWDAAMGVWGTGDRRARHHAGQVLRWLADRVPDGAWTDVRRRGAVQVGARVDRTPEIGAMVFPAVGGEGRFVTVRAEVVSGADRVPEVEPDTASAIVAALAAARRFERAPERRFSVHFDAEGWSGASCGLAVALAAISAGRGAAWPAGWVATGALTEGGRVDDVAADARKATLRLEARPRARMLVPASWRSEEPALVPVPDLGAAVARLAPEGEDVSDALRRVRDLDRSGRWIEAARGAEALLGSGLLESFEREYLLLLLLTAANHGADPEARRRWTALLGQDRRDHPDLEAWARAVGSRAVGALDDLDPAEARAALALAGELPGPVRVHVRGPAAMLATMEGRHEEAVALRRESLAGAKVSEKGRCLGDLADALLRVGEAADALEACEEGLRLLGSARRDRDYAARTRGYLELHRGRALLALGRVDEAAVVVAHAPDLPGLDPRFRLELLGAEILGDRGRVDRAWQDLPSFLRQGLLGALRDRARWRLGDLEAGARLVAIAPFRGLDADEAGRRLPY